MEDRSRRPHHSPRRTPEAMEGRILALRDAHAHWGGRKLRRLLRNEGVDGVPAPSGAWRGVYNWERPHLALGLATPGSRYQSSPQGFPEQLPPIAYGPDDEVRRVQQHGIIHFRGREYRVGKAFRGYPVALRPLLTDGHYAVYSCHHQIATINCAGESE